MQLYHWRAFIGPAYEPAASGYQYDWITPWIIAELDLAGQATTLTNTLNSGSTVATLTTAGNLAGNIGGAWIGPNGAGQAWEYVSYTAKGASQITGLRREPTETREHNGTHTAGATVRQWWPLTADTGSLHLTEQIDPTMSAITWQAEIAGIYGPPAALRNGHLIAIQTRQGAAGTWTLFLMGFIQAPQMRDDAGRLRSYSFKIISLAQQIAGWTAKPIRVGELDLAPAGSAQADTPLASPTKEIYSGDYTAAAPDFGGDSTIDEENDTLWIAERLRGDAPAIGYPAAPSSLQYGGFLTGARLWRWPGEAKGHRWIELITPAVGGQRILNNAWICHKSATVSGWVAFNGLNTEAGQLIIICENESIFTRENPLASPIGTFEIGSAFFDALDPAGDAVAIFMSNPGDDWSPTVAWGTGGTPKLTGEPDGHTWTANTIPAPAIGKIIRYAYYAPATRDKDHFIVDYNDMAGYRTGGEDPWVLIDLPRLDLTLRDDITAGAPAAGARLYLRKGEADSTEGLKTAGTIQIGQEQITYSARYEDGVTVSARGANGTTAATHNEGDLIRVIDTDGTATEGQLISSIRWNRNGRPTYPQSFRIRRSNLDQARTPPDDNHTDDYEELVHIQNQASAAYTLNLSPARRATAVIIEIDRMNTNPGRPRLNTINIIASPEQYDPAYVLPATTIDVVIAQILQNAGLGVFAITQTTSTAIDKLQTAAGDSAWAVIADLAAKTNTLIDATRKGKIAAGPNNLPAGSLSAAATWTDVNAAALEHVQTAAKPYSQIKQPWRLNDGTTGTEKYPATIADASAPVLELEEARFSSQAAALAAAKRAYILARYPVQWIVETAEEAPTMRPGTVVNVNWQFAADQQPVSRIGCVMATDHQIQAGRWTTVLTIAQLDREAAG